MQVALVHGVSAANGTGAAYPIHDFRISGSISFIIEAKIYGVTGDARSGDLLLGQTGVALLLETALLFRNTGLLLGGGGQAHMQAACLPIPIIGVRDRPIAVTILGQHRHRGHTRCKFWSW